MCGRKLKIYSLGLALLLLLSVHIYSLDEAEAQELTEILTQLEGGLSEVEKGLSEISSGQNELEEELTMLDKQTKKLQMELNEQKKAQLKLEEELNDLESSFERTEKRNKILSYALAGTSAVALASLVLVVIQ